VLSLADILTFTTVPPLSKAYEVFVPLFFFFGHSLWFLCGWSRCSGSLASLRGSANTKGSTSFLNAAILIKHFFIDLQLAPINVILHKVVI